MEKKVIDLSKETEPFTLILPGGIQLGTANRGYSIEVTFGIKPFDLVPKSWEELRNNSVYDSEQSPLEVALFHSYLVKDYEDAEAFLALIQLRRLWHEWVNVLGEPNYGGEEDYNYITWSCVHNSPVIAKSELKTYRSLAFIKYDHAKKFIECFGELLEKAKILL